MKNIFLLLLLTTLTNLNAQITISEILFEEPSWNPNLVYLELTNLSDEPVNISEWSISGVLNLPTLPDVNISPGGFYVICSDFDAIFAFGLATSPGEALFITGSQNFGNPFFVLKNPDGKETARIEYDPNLNWPVPEAGVSIELCDPSLDINNGLNWALAETSISVGGDNLLGTPGKENTCSGFNTSSKEIKLSQRIKLFPNPCNSILNIKLEGTVESLKVYSSTGTKLLDVSNANSIDVSSLSKGFYNIYIMSNGVKYYQNFVKI